MMTPTYQSSLLSIKLKLVLPLLMLLLPLALQPRSLPSSPTMCFSPPECFLTLVATGDVAPFFSRPCTWAAFKVNFALAHQELRNSKVTSNQAGYQAANNAAAYDTASYNIQQETALAILANLATATALDRSTVASLTATISNLSNKLKLANDKLVHVTAKLASLKLAMASPLTSFVPTSTPKPKPKPTVP
jgi:hypothetical protein